MAVTHDDLAPSRRRGTDIGSKTSVVLMVFSLLLGLLCFVLCLIAEAKRSQLSKTITLRRLLFGVHVDGSCLYGNELDPNLISFEASKNIKPPLNTTWNGEHIVFRYQKLLVEVETLNKAKFLQIIREVSDGGGGDTAKTECRYSGNGKIPLICAAGAFLSLAVAMVLQHTHLLLSVSKSDPDPSQLLTWDPDHLKSLSWQAGFFFITTWICFSVAEILLLIGLSVESGHLKGWSTSRTRCFIAREGLFSAAGVLGITTVFLAAGLSITALRAQWLLQDQENVRREVIETSILYASPPRMSEDRIRAVRGEAPIARHDLYHEPGLIEYLRAFDKII
uniref:uncharacterized protein LOC122610457 n=1 Tax=Erigeron canadensis TaxID=72917 RepID=UPI001CB9CAA7|nr:uncharacterized protein LOC122610457 [Erigeron canadensis]